ncbi:hypothetical protein [Lysinibacillus pakistanensis]|nr:hypothetical protein [Lysinibacillus pakistanensis]
MQNPLNSILFQFCTPLMINLKEFIQEGVVGMSEKEIDELVTELRNNSVE